MLLLIGYPIAYGIARAARRAGDTHSAGDPAVLDVVFDQGLRLDHHPSARRSVEPHALGPGHHRVSGGLARERHSDLHRPRLFLFAVHGAAALRNASKHDPALLEAAADLGARRWKAFWSVTLPLSWPGIAAGALLCFIPIVGEFVIPDLLGGSETMMIGQTLWTEFFANRDWPIASAIAIALLCVILGPIAMWENLRARQLQGSA